MTNDQTPTPDPAPANPGTTPAPPPTPREPLRIRFGLWFLKITNAPTDEVNADGSRWPGSRRQFLWDLVPGDIAPGSDGVIPPGRGEELDWTNNVEEKDLKEAYERARRYRQDADDTTRNLELKASRFATFLVALLTANVALVVFELSRLGSNPDALRIVLVVISAVLGLRSARWLVPGLIQAIDADQRMGVTTVSTLDDAALNPRNAMRDEVHGFNTSNWTRRKKADTLIFARASVSRSLVSLVPSVLLSVVLVINYTLTEDPADNRAHGRHDHAHGHHHRMGSRPAPPNFAPSRTPSPRPTKAPIKASTPKPTAKATKTP